MAKAFSILLLVGCILLAGEALYEVYGRLFDRSLVCICILAYSRGLKTARKAYKTVQGGFGLNGLGRSCNLLHALNPILRPPILTNPAFLADARRSRTLLQPQGATQVGLPLHIQPHFDFHPFQLLFHTLSLFSSPFPPIFAD